MTRVLVVSSDVVGERMAGPGIRAWELSRVLAASHEVTLAAAAPLPEPEAGFKVVEATRSRLRSEALLHDVVVAQGSMLAVAPDLRNETSALVIDLYDPFLVEGLELHAGLPQPEREDHFRRDLASLRLQCLSGDFFICASERQRLFWLGILAAFGRVNPATFDAGRTLRGLLAVVPFGIPAEPPAAARRVIRGVLPGVGENDQVVLWGGGLWNWLDPLTLIRAVGALAPELPRLRLVFLGTAHPNAAVPRMRMLAQAEALARELGLLDRVVTFRRGWVPYAERGAYLAESNLGVSLHLPGIEADLAFRTRVLDYLWAGLPSVLTEGDATADLVAAAGAGIAVPPGDPGAVADALRRLLTDGELSARSAAAARGLAEELLWEHAAAPLEEFCRRPRQAPDRAQLDLTGGIPPGTAGLGKRAWRVLRREGLGALAARGYRYARRSR